MRPLSIVCRNPLPVLGTLALAFVAWVAYEGTGDRPAGPQPPFPDAGLKTAFHDGTIPPLPPQATAETLPRLKPGMTRAEVEGLVGAPRADGIGPAAVSGDRVTYHATYDADLTPAHTVRPLGRAHLRHRTLTPPRETADLVILEFDASRPGHPLVGVHYPDPLF